MRRSVAFALASAAAAASCADAALVAAQRAAPPSSIDVLESQISELKGKTASLQDDKRALLKTVQQVLRTNQSDVLQHQLADMTRLKVSVEQRCANERAKLEQRAKAAEDEAADAKEVVQSLKDQTLDLQVLVKKLQAENEQLRKTSSTLAADKSHLMEAMHSMLRKSAGYSSPGAAEEAPACDCQHLAKEASHAHLVHAVAANATNGTAHKNASGEVAATAAASQRLRGGAEKSSGKKKKVAKEPSMEDDPIRYMAETGAITAYVARATAEEAAKAAAAGALQAAAAQQQQQQAAAPPPPPPPSSPAAPSSASASSSAKGKSHAAKEPRNLLRWLDGDAPAAPAGAAGSQQLSAVDQLDPQAAAKARDEAASKSAEQKRAEVEEDEGDAAVQGLLDQAEAELGPGSQ